MEKLVLIDGNSLINRAFYAMPVLYTKDGTPTNAVFGFTNMLVRILTDIKPTYMAVAFDVKAPTFRHGLFADYKGTRKPMPDELRPQIPLLKEVLTLMGITVIEKPGSEADDIIGTIAKHTSIKTLIFTGDKDSFQLVDEETEVHFTKRGITDTDIYTDQNFTEKTGITPLQIIELKALMGDSSDNIPGVKGIGEKTALNLLSTYHDVENLYAHVDELSGKLKEKIEQGKDLCFLSKTLATIDCDCGVDTDVSKMTVSLPFPQDVKKKFIELEFKALYNKEQLFEKEQSPSLSVKTDTPLELIDLSKDVSFDLKSLTPPLAITLSGTSFNVADKDREVIIPIQQTLLDQGLSLSNALALIRPLVTGTAPLIVYGKKDFRHFIVKNGGFDLTAPADDISLMKYLADFSGRDESLTEVLTEYDMPLNAPAHALLDLYDMLLDKLESQKMQALYKEVELPLSDVLFDMEVAGFKIDYDALSKAGETYKVTLSGLEEQIRTLAEDQTLNVNSPKQLGDLLFEKLKIGKGKKTKTGYSTTAEILESLESAHPIVPLILKHRQLQKIYSTYIEGFKPLVDKRTGLIHTSFNQTVTATGRLSSKEPNLQNIPVRDDESKEIRRLFVPKGDDRILISADYSQIELRLLAAFSGCTPLINAFKEGKDVHSATASKVFNVPLDEVTPKMRSSAKAVNFGIIYGMSEFGLAKSIKVSNAEARNYISTYFKEYPEVKEYMDKNVAFAKENGYAITLLGRRRYIRELSSSNGNVRQFGERVAMNMPLQGSSADIIKLAMLGVSKRLRQENLKSQLILQVHDELIIDTFKDEEEKVSTILVEEMENAVSLAVKLTVGVGSGKNWLEAK
ncbi:MAG: DNA polymerase I [Clostridia bacterium]|nr:DNA polymerase I [Clostridia bacterium]